MKGKFYILALCAVVSTFALAIKISNISVVLLIVAFALNYMNFEFNFKFKNTQFFILFASFFALYLLHFIFNGFQDFSTVDKNLPWLVFPLILISKFDLVKYNLIAKVFVLATFVVNIVLISNNLLNFINSGEWLVFHDFTEIFNIHAVYISYFNFLALLYLIIENENLRFPTIQKAVLLFFITVGLLFCASKMVIIVAFITFAVYFVSYFNFSKGLLLGAVVVLCSFVFIISKNSKFSTRMNEIFELRGIEYLSYIDEGKPLANNEKRELNGTTLRLFIWKLATKIPNGTTELLFGVSPENENKRLFQQFEKYEMDEWFGFYGFHNQYISYIIQFGVLGLLLYMVICFNTFKLFIQKKDVLASLFFGTFLVFQLSESMLNRSKGLVFFVFFTVLLIKKNLLDNENSNSRN